MTESKINGATEKRVKTSYVGSAPAFETTGGVCALVLLLSRW